MLMGIEIPDNQGNTIFSSGFNSYKKLPEEIKRYEMLKVFFHLQVQFQKLVEN